MELTVRVGYWRTEDRDAVNQTVEALRVERELTHAPEWSISYYPAEGPVELIEFNLAPEESPAESEGISQIP